MDAHQPDKLDLYSVPVFVLELVILIGLAFSAHYIHFDHKHEPILTGFYCDDISLRHEYRQSQLIEHFTRPDDELVLLGLLLVVPIVVIIFCELVNSMFGSLKFRRIRALCKCCKLHSITRRTIRFSGAYILGFLLVMISCDTLANTAGRFKPYFAQECPTAFKSCLARPSAPLSNPMGSVNLLPSALISDAQGAAGPDPLRPTPAAISIHSNDQPAPTTNGEPAHSLRPPSPPIMSNNTTSLNPLPASLLRARRDLDTSFSVDRRLLERQWVLLEDVNLTQLCGFAGDEIQTRKFNQLARSWPSFPASIITYACLYLAAYLCFVGTARPCRVITSVLVLALVLLSTTVDVLLVRAHFNHWEDSLSGAILALLIVVFVLYVYLNLFRDSHYYANQRLAPKRRRSEHNISNGYSNEIAMEQYSLDKPDDEQVPGQNTSAHHNSGAGDTSGSMPNNDLAMRYFQIPRANYRGAPRPLSSNTNNHM